VPLPDLPSTSRVPTPTPTRALRRLAARVAVSRSRPRSAPAADTDTAETSASPGRSTGHRSGAFDHLRPPLRPDPVLRWKNPGQPPAGNFAPCAVPNAQLRVHGIPDHSDSWDGISSFCLSYDGYAYWDDVSELATRSIRDWTRHRTLPPSVDEVRGCLFYEQRRWHHFGEEPNGRGANYLWALLDTLRNLVAARTAADKERELDPGTSIGTGTAPVTTAAKPVSVRRPGPVRSFLEDDAGYLAWAAEHPLGFVVNADRTLSPRSLTLHRASCASIGRPPAAGQSRTTNHRKVCAVDRDALVSWCREDIGADPGSCSHCLPVIQLPHDERPS
jgi:hypothetical protein